MPAQLRVYVTAFLFHEDRVLLLRRSDLRGFAPGRWTGIGGRVEAIEMDDLEGAMVREMGEETGLSADDVKRLKLRVVLTQPEENDLVTLAFYSGIVKSSQVGRTKEGELRWVCRSAVNELDLIENAAFALGWILDRGADDDSVHLGVCDPGGQGRIHGMDYNSAGRP